MPGGVSTQHECEVAVIKTAMTKIAEDVRDTKQNPRTIAFLSSIYAMLPSILLERGGTCAGGFPQWARFLSPAAMSVFGAFLWVYLLGSCYNLKALSF